MTTNFTNDFEFLEIVNRCRWGRRTMMAQSLMVPDVDVSSDDTEVLQVQ